MVSSPIGGFMPIPLAMMIPFMATQSMIMGVAFGEAYQYGKRKISAMTNEEFNAFTMEKMAMEVFTDYKQIIPKLKDSIQDSTELQKHIVNEMLKLPFELIAGIGEKVQENVKGTALDPSTVNTTPVGTTLGRTTTSRPTPTKSATINGATSLWINANSRPDTTKVWRFLERAYHPDFTTIKSVRANGSKMIKRVIRGKLYQSSYLYTVTYTSTFPLPKTITIEDINLV